MAENLQQLLEQKDRDLELAAQYGTALLGENKQLKEKLKELKEKVASMEMEGSYEMKEQIQLLEESNKVLKSKITILESKNGDLEAKVILKNSQKEDLAQTIDELTRKLKNADERIGMLQKELENNSTAGTIYELNEQLEMQKEVILDLRTKHSETQRINTELTKKLDDLTKKMDKLSASQVSNEIDPALLEELKDLRQANAQFKRDIKEKDDIIAELQTRPAEPRPTIYQRTIVEVPAYAPVPGNSESTSENYPTGFSHLINADSDITAQPKTNNATDAQSNFISDTLTPATPTRTAPNSTSAPITAHGTTEQSAVKFSTASTPDRNEEAVHDATYVANKVDETGPREAVSMAARDRRGENVEHEGVDERRYESRPETSQAFSMTARDRRGENVEHEGMDERRYESRPETSQAASMMARDPRRENVEHEGEDERRYENRPEPSQVNGHAKSEPLAIQKHGNSHQTDAKPTEKTPPSSPKALYRDPRVQELASKLAEAERQLTIKSDEVQRLSLKLVEMAERTSTVVPQTTIINQIVQPKKEGFLIKQGARVKNWKRRFFFIESNFLYYSESPKTRFVTFGMINLDGAEVDQAIVPNRAHVIAVKTSSRTFYLCAESEEDMREWLDVLKEKIADIAEKKKNDK